PPSRDLAAESQDLHGVVVRGRGDDLVRHHAARTGEVRALEGPAIADAPLGLRDDLLLRGLLAHVEGASRRQQRRQERHTHPCADTHPASALPAHFSVSIRPLTNHRWPRTAMATGGSRASVTVAITRFHSAAASPVGSTRLMPMTTVSMLSSVVIMSG